MSTTSPEMAEAIRKARENAEAMERLQADAARWRKVRDKMRTIRYSFRTPVTYYGEFKVRLAEEYDDYDEVIDRLIEEETK